MTETKEPIPIFRHKHLPTVHWKDSKEMNRAIHSFPGMFRAIFLEFLDGPMSRYEIRDFLNRIARGDRRKNRLARVQLQLEKNLNTAQELNILKKKVEKYYLTPAGIEMAEYMQLVIPAFITWVFSPKTVSLFSLGAYVVLSLLKLGIGLVSGSAGLLADGIDNTVDTLSSLLVWLGIKYNREKLVSVFIVITMFLSIGGIALTTIDKFFHLEPVKNSLTAFSVSLVCGLVMLGLSSYQYMVGTKTSNLAVMCQSVDSRNHFWASLLVCGGIISSFFAEAFHIAWLHYADGLASALIGLIILKGAIELTKELYKESEAGADISHFMKAYQERHREKLLFKWLSAQLHSRAFSRKELEDRFASDFCKKTPKILTITEFGYRPESGTELSSYLDRFVKQEKLIEDNGWYWLIA